jgi:outer membrane protein assembly factor BamB
MNQEEKLKLAKQVMQIAGIFSLVVAGVLLINFMQLKKYEPLESETLSYLVEQLKDDSRNEQLMEEIRNFDLLVRKAYFTSAWQVKIGTFLLLFGGILFGLSLKVYKDLRKKIGIPEKDTESFLTGRSISYKWLLVTGVLIFGLAIVAGFSSKNYLNDYYALPEQHAVGEQVDESIEVVEIVEVGAEEGAEKGAETGADVGAENSSEAAVERIHEFSPTESSPSVEKPYGLEEFKKQHNTFRGPMGLGISYHKNIPVNWDGAAGTNIIWKVALSKPGYNSPVVWGDKVFLAGADAEARLVSCYNKKTGQVLWEKKADDIPGSPATMPKVTEDTGLSAPTMAVDGYRVYALFATGDVIAFDLNGNRKWARNLGVPKNHYGHSSSLMVWNNKLIIQYDTGRGGRMLALNSANGESVWDVKRDNNISWATPILIEVDGKMQVITTTDPNVAGHDLETGEEIWKVAVMMGEVGPSCAYDDGLVFANNEYASLVAINPEPGASVQWENYDYLSEAASPVAKDGLLFLATSYGVFVCYDTKTGEQVWEKDFGATLYSSPMIADGKIYIMENTGVMHVMKADRSGEVVSEPNLGESSYAIPAFDEGRIFIRGAESLYCIGE